MKWLTVADVEMAERWFDHQAVYSDTDEAFRRIFASARAMLKLEAEYDEHIDKLAKAEGK